MTIAVKIFKTKITDEYGGEYPQAIAAAHSWSFSTQKTGSSTNCEGNYLVIDNIKELAYKLSYWYSERTKEEGKKSRPLVVDENGVFNDLFKADLTHKNIIAILNSELPEMDKIVRIIEVDALIKFA